MSANRQFGKMRTFIKLKTVVLHSRMKIYSNADEVYIQLRMKIYSNADEVYIQLRMKIYSNADEVYIHFSGVYTGCWQACTNTQSLSFKTANMNVRILPNADIH